jgi:Sulfotransferase family
MSELTTTHELIMVMGVQRSGTSALFQALATDNTLTAFGEDIDSAFYDRFRLRRVGELAPLIERSSRRILLKPISETFVRSLTDIADEFSAYQLRFVWIYRDPVNVLHSMQRERWIAAQDLAQPSHLHAWQKRNQYALEFQQQSPDQIAIVRYEDLCLDPAVFDQLTLWLGLKCKSPFGHDSAMGRKHVPRITQRRINAVTGRTLRALDRARIFRPRRSYRLQQMVSYWRERIVGTDAVQSCDPARPHVARMWAPAAATPAPSDVPGLYFWLNAAAICERNGPLDAPVTESAPQRIIALVPENGPYGFLSLNLRCTLYYPQSKVSMRRAGASGTLIFRGASDWNFFFNGSGFVLFALFRPNPPSDQMRSTLMRVGSQSEAAPAFSLQWDACTNASDAVILSGVNGRAVTNVVSTTPGSHARQQWGLIAVECARGVLSISTQGTRYSIEVAGDLGAESRGDCGLELGGFTAERESLFYGEIADLIIFRRPLSTEEISDLTGYLITTHRL